MKRLIFILLILAALLSACAPPRPASLQVTDAWVRAAKPETPSVASEASAAVCGAENAQPVASQANSAAYMSIYNPSTQSDRLLSVETGAAAAVEIHETIMANDVMSMHRVDAIEIPAGVTVELKPGGFHVMLFGLTCELAPGGTLPLTLVFETAGRVEVEAAVSD
jgi:hypothetical protein